MSSTGNPRCCSRVRITVPTCPVAPKSPTLTPTALALQLEGRVQDLDGLLDLVVADDAADADRRRRDHVNVDALGGEDLEHLGGDARVGLHPRPDEADSGDLSVGDDLG